MLSPRAIAAALVLVLAGGSVAADAATSRAGQAAPEPGASGIGDSYWPLDGNGGIDVLAYDVDDSYRLASGKLSGRTSLDVRATQALSRFNLDLLLPVRSVRVDGVAADFSKPNKHEVRITPATPIADGQHFEVVVSYAGRPGDYSYAGESNWLADEHEVVAMNQPHMATWWFAANDHPSDKALMDITITGPADKSVIANGRRIGRTVDGNRATTRWKADEPMATYLAFFALGDWKVATGERDGLPWRAVVSRHLSDRQQRVSMQLMKETPAVIASLSEDLGPYPFSTSGGLTTSLPVYFALENQTMPTYPVLSQSYGFDTVVHEQAHQWFGDDVAIAKWKDIWLNEGAATFMEKRYIETHGGESADAWMRGMYADRDASEHFWDLEIREPGAGHIFDTPVYYRGAMALQALRNRIGEDDFWMLVRTWLENHSGGNGSTSQFTALAQDISGEDLSGFFAAWLQPGKPADTVANGLG